MMIKIKKIMIIFSPYVQYILKGLAWRKKIMMKISKKIGFCLKKSNLMGPGSKAYSGGGQWGLSPSGPVKSMDFKPNFHAKNII